MVASAGTAAGHWQVHNPCFLELIVYVFAHPLISLFHLVIAMMPLHLFELVHFVPLCFPPLGQNTALRHLANS